MIDPVSGMDMSQFAAPPPQQGSDVPPGTPMMKVTPQPAQAAKGVDPVSGIDFDQSQFPPIPTPPVKATPGGMMRNIGAGLQEGAAGTMNVLSDPFGNLVGKPLATAAVFAHDVLAPHFGGRRFTDEERNQLLNDTVPQPGTRVVNAIDTAGGAPTPEQVPSVGAERAVRAGVAGASGMAGLGPAGPVLNAAMGAGGALAADQVEQSPSIPEYAKPIASLGANIAGNAIVGGGAAGVSKVYNGATRIGGNLGIGRKEMVGSAPATATQIETVGGRIADALGPEGQDALSAATAQPGMGAPSNGEIVPGSQPTTAQIAPTPAMVEMDKASRVANPAEFNARAAAQNNARVEAVRGLAPEEAEPALLGQYFTKQLQDIDAQHAGDLAAGQRTIAQEGEQATQQARNTVQGVTQAVGGTTAPDVTGETIRTSLADRNASARAAESKLWQSIDPEGKLALPLGDVQQTARSLMKDIDPNLGDQLGPQESLILKGAAALPDVVPFKDAQRLRSNIGQAERTLRAMPGNEQSLRRLGLLKSSLDDAIANGVDAAGGGSGQAGVVEGQNGLGYPGEGVRGPLPGGNPGPAAAPGLPERAGSPDEAGRGGGLGAGNSPVAAPAAVQGSASDGGLTPNFNADAANRYSAARQSTLERKQTYGQGPVGAVLRPGRQGAEFNVENAAVARQFLTGNSTEPARVQAFKDAVGGELQAVDAMREALVSDLRQRRIINEDGMVQPDRLNAWLQPEARGRTVDLFPGLRDQLGSAEAAQRTYDQTVADHAARLDAFNKQAAADHIAQVTALKKTGGQFATAEPMDALKRLFASKTRTQDFQDVVNQAKGNPEVLDGLKRLTADYIEQRFSGAKPSGEDADFLKAAQFRKFIDDRREPLKVIFGGQGLQNLEMVAADLRRQAMATAAPATPGSDTAQKLSVIRKESGGEYHPTAIAVLGEQFGELASHTLGAHPLMGKLVGLASGVGSILLHTMKQAGISTKSDLIREAMLNPALAKELMTRATASRALSQMSQRRIARAIQAATINNAIGQSNQEPKQ